MDRNSRTIHKDTGKGQLQKALAMDPCPVPF